MHLQSGHPAVFKVERVGCHVAFHKDDQRFLPQDLAKLRTKASTRTKTAITAAEPSKPQIMELGVGAFVLVLNRRRLGLGKARLGCDLP